MKMFARHNFEEFAVRLRIASQCADSFLSSAINLQKKVSSMQSFESSRKNNHSILTGSYYCGAMGVFLVFNVTNDVNFFIFNWLSDIYGVTPEQCLLMFVQSSYRKEKRDDAILKETGIKLFEVVPRKKTKVKEDLLNFTKETLRQYRNRQMHIDVVSGFFSSDRIKI